MDFHNMVLRNGFHGVDQTEVLMRIEAINRLIDAVASGSMFREQALEEAKRLAAEPLKKARNGFLEEDVEQCFAEMIEAI